MKDPDQIENEKNDEESQPISRREALKRMAKYGAAAAGLAAVTSCELFYYDYYDYYSDYYYYYYDYYSNYYYNYYSDYYNYYSNYYY